MTTTEDLKSTLNLPRTDFPMKANLAQAEPKRLEEWERSALYAAVRAARKGAPVFVLHDGPPYANGDIHLGTVLNKVLKDIVVRSRTMFGYDAPYVPGWDCHGLPIELKVDKDLGSKKKAMSAAEFRRALPQVRREVAGHPARAVQAPGRHGRVGRPLHDHGARLPGDHRARAGDVRREGPRLQGQEVRALVHLVPHRAGRGRGRVRRRARRARRSTSASPRRTRRRRRSRQRCRASAGAA